MVSTSYDTESVYFVETQFANTVGTDWRYGTTKRYLQTKDTEEIVIESDESQSSTPFRMVLGRSRGIWFTIQ